MSLRMTAKTRRLVLLGSIVLLVAAAAAVLTSVIAARGTGSFFASGVGAQPCIRDAIGAPEGEVCTANDVKVGSFSLESGPTECIPGETIAVTLRARLESKPEKYDIGIWVDQEGGDAMEAGGPDGNPDLSVNRCYRDYLNPVSEDNTSVNLASGSGDFYNAEVGTGDACGDVPKWNDWPVADDKGPCTTGGGTCVFTYYEFSASIECRDLDGNGVADVGACASWQESDSGSTCENGNSFLDDAVPGTSSKCACDSVEIAGLIVPKTGTIQVYKVLDPTNDAGRFNLQIDGQDEATGVGNGGSTEPVIVSAGTDPPGTGETHTVGETAFTGTDLLDYNTSILCDDETGPNSSCSDCTSLSINVLPEEDILCTITNARKTGSLEIIKDVDPDAPGTNWDINVSGPTSLNDTLTGDDTTGAQTVDTGDYTISESAGSGNNLNDYNTSWDCTVDGGSGPSGTGTTINVSVDEGQAVVCTFTNTRKTGSLEVIKDVDPDAPGTNWDINVSGPTPFSDTLTGDDTTGAQTVDTGDYTIVESAGSGTSLDDYNTTYACTIDGQTGPSGRGTSIDVPVGEGEAVVCTFTNTRKTGSLTIIKDLVPDLDPGLFNLQIDGVTDSDAENVGDGGSTGQQEVNTGTHTVGETAGTGTSLGDYDIAISCVDQGGTGSQVASSSDAGPLDVDVGENDDIVCTIINIIRVVPPDGGVDLPTRVIIDGLAAVGTALLLAGVYLRHKMLQAG